VSPLEKYLRHLSVERGLSKNTLNAYRADLVKYENYLEAHGHSLATVSAGALSEYAISLGAEDLKASSITRALAAIRGLHKFMALEGIRVDDPTVKIRPPKLPFRLPKALSQQQVLALLAASGPEPDDEVADLMRLRDRAILETMYSSGARVSEIVGLDLDEIDDSGLVRVRGKGSKERVVPLGSFAMRAIQAYLVRTRPMLAELASSNALF